jgi:hypothetical protein
MRFSFFTLVCFTCAICNLQAEQLKEADRETLLDNLEKIQKAAKEKGDSRFLSAITAFRNAIGSDSAAFDLYLNCIERVEFIEKYKEPVEFREWKRKESEPNGKLDKPGLRLALRHQLRWLMLTLEAASPGADRDKLAVDAIEILDAIFREPAKLKKSRDTLEADVVGTVFAKAYDVDHVRPQDWANAPGNLGQVFDKVILPPYRKPGRLTDLRAGWVRRIQLETLKMEHWTENESGRNEDGEGNEKESEKKEENRIGTVESMRSPEYTKFIYEGLPQLQWEMEVDLFKNGDESGAAVRMLAHTEKHIHHVSAKKWADEFAELLKPAPKTAN